MPLFQRTVPMSHSFAVLVKHWCAMQHWCRWSVKNQHYESAPWSCGDVVYWWGALICWCRVVLLKWAEPRWVPPSLSTVEENREANQEAKTGLKMNEKTVLFTVTSSLQHVSAKFLWHHVDATQARNYLLKRNIGPQVCLLALSVLLVFEMLFSE